MSHSTLIRFGTAALLLALLGVRSASVHSDTVYFAGTPPVIAQVPLYIEDSVPPLNMLVMGKDHKIYYEAYNDASDLDGDGILDVGYRGWELKSPAPTDGSSRYKIDYYGYFNSYVCYRWDSGSGGRFIPQTANTNKQCSGAWSGDFLNYLTMSRMDALRRVLYGGWRNVDTTSSTILQGAFFPQDAHSWGKEYQSIARDGYDIRNYAAVSALPESGNYHLFAVTTTTDSGLAFPNYTAPRFRVLTNSRFRVWQWVSIEGPVANRRCVNQSTFCTTAGGEQAFPGHPGSLAAFNTMESTYAIPANLYGTSSLDRIDCNSSNCNPHGVDDNYLSIITGQLRVRAGRGGTYQFRIDGDDAIDFVLTDLAGNVVATAGCYNDRGFGGPCTGSTTTAAVTLSAGLYNLKFRHEEATGGDGYRLEWQKTAGGNAFGYEVLRLNNNSRHSGNGGLEANVAAAFYDLTPIVGASTMTDYFVRVEACPAGAANAALRDSVCKAYGSAANPIYKPTGILHDYGETRKMFFGLITGSQQNNIEGGVLRSNIEDFNREIDPASGVFRTDVEGIVRSIDRLRMIGGGYNSNVTDNLSRDTNWNWANSAHGVGGNCVSQGGRAVNNGECRMWGNPIAEMLFEGLRYFAGAGAATARFATSANTEGQTEDTRLGLPTPAWRNPYADTVVNGNVTHPAYPSCARPHQTIISDINPSYDGDLPGSEFNNTGNDAALPGLNVATQGQQIWNAEFGAGARSVFIGEVDGQATDGAPTAKSASSFGDIRGLAPEEPTKQGTYYSASVARYGRNADINTATGPQNVNTYSIALASPLPRIEFPVNGQTVTLLPFAKTVSGTFGENPLKPTNTIVDFYVEGFTNFPGQPTNSAVNGGRPRAIFRINYEDVEQGNDHDMDVIGRYVVNANANGTVTIELTAEYAAGSANQNVGYVISGTTDDGIYLEVRDTDNTNMASSAYELNTPAGVSAGGCVNAMSTAPCNQGLPHNASRTFTPGTAAGGTQLRDPLWYAAKYGSPTPNAWDEDGDGEPDNYFLVTNPLNLRAQLSEAFDNISEQTIDAGSRSLTGARVGSASFTLLPSFRRERNGKDWSGNLSATAVNQDGTLATTELWNALAGLPAHGSRDIFTTVTPGISTTKVAREFLGDNNNLGNNEATRLGRLGITENLSTTPNSYGATYTADAIVDYLRGDQSREQGNTGAGNTLRERSAVLGDIVNSEPIIASPRSDFGYGSYSNNETVAMFSGYSNTGGYLATKANRDTVVYFGANDGMLHAFNGNTRECAGNTSLACAGDGAGQEMFAFIPNSALQRMGRLALPDARYEHEYYVDGQLTVTDAKDSGGWKTLLVGAMGGGGRSVFALDVSDPDNFDASDVLWELNGSTDNDIGNVYGRPLLLPLENNRWGVLFGNGYGGNRSDPSLYIVDAFTGQQIAKLTANDGNLARTPSALGGLICGLLDVLLGDGHCAETSAPFNGLGQITAIDRDGNGKADTVYGGDLQGNLWKFDLSNTANASAWNVALGGQPLVTAYASNGQRQPITGGIRVSAGPGAGVMVYFGTGRYFVEGDNDVPAAPDVQSLYGVFDNGTPIAIANAAAKDTALQRQWIQQEVTDPDSGATTRDISRNRVSFYGANAKRGWYLDLVINNVAGNASGAGLDPVGERFIATPRIQSGRVFYTTFSPTGDSCEPGGVNIIYALDLLSGSGALTNVRSLGSDTPACTGENCGAVVTDQAGAPITSTSVAAIKPTRFINNPACDPAVENCPTFEECQVVIYPGGFVLPRPCGRQSWRQLK